MVLGIQHWDEDQRVIFIFVALLFLAIPIRIPDPETRTQREFRNFITTFNRTYYGNETEYQKRYRIFKETFDWLEGVRQDSRPVFGINRYSDLTDIEFIQKFLVASTRRNATRSRRSTTASGLNRYEDLPHRVDWRERGIITPIRRQGDVCGSCYAESVIANAEAMLALKWNSLKAEELSVQQVIDCVGASNMPCEVGGTCHVLRWLNANNITIIPKYIYTASKEKQLASCKHPRVAARTVRITDSTCSSFVAREREMLAFLAFNGPLIASVNALPWRHYVSGVITHLCDGPPNHTVQIVGYNLGGEHEATHFIVRNSWGSDFGEAGYVRIAIGANVCSIAEEVSSMTVD